MNRSVLVEAYETLFHKKPAGLQNWQMAREFIEKFDGNGFVGDEGKELIACAALTFILSYVTFPVSIDGGLIYRSAAGLLSELDTQICEVDMNESVAAHLLDKYKEKLQMLESTR